MSLPSTTLYLVYAVALQSLGACFLVALLLLESGPGLCRNGFLCVFFEWLFANYFSFFILLFFVLVVMMILGHRSLF